MTVDVFSPATTVADAVLLEGYVLYPYRASAQKNQVRWQFGVLMPPGADASEPSSSTTECLLEPGPGCRVRVRLRCLQVQQRTVMTPHGPVASLDVGEATYVSFDEGVLREVDEEFELAELVDVEQRVSFSFLGGQPGEGSREDLPGSDAWLERRLHPVDVTLHLTAESIDGPYGVVRLGLRVENTTAWSGGTREEALRRALVAAHSLIAVEDGRFLSLVEPPAWAAAYAAECHNERTWPVLVGDRDSRRLVLSSPIILYDFPETAPESPGDLFDALEIDEILTLRTMALTDEEKREARATDPRTAELIDRVDTMPQEVLDRLHGALRYMRSVTDATDVEPDPFDPAQDAAFSPETDVVMVDGTPVCKGTTVRLHPRAGSDAQDMFLDGLLATVAGVYFDVDGTTHVAVTLVDDPAADLQVSHGRYRYFSPDELEPRP